MLLSLSENISRRLKIEFEFINIGGGFGIPYQIDEKPLNVFSLGSAIKNQFRDFDKRNGYMPKLFIENGRYVSGPHGVLVVKAINRKNIYRTYIGVDASMNSLMRPGLYNAYHHITVFGKHHESCDTIVDVVGSLCENNDKFAVQRKLPDIIENDILLIHDTGAHGHAMGFNYNGRLRPKELLLRADGSVELIRREEGLAEYFATLDFEKNDFVSVG
jgi:diaminopimelate decarboxylase